jgi:methionyl-tRNA synthetase
METYEFDKAVASLYEIVNDVNRDIEQHRPWELIQRRQTAELRGLLARWLEQVWVLATWLAPLLPNTSTGIVKRLYWHRIERCTPLFPKLG